MPLHRATAWKETCSLPIDPLRILQAGLSLEILRDKQKPPAVKDVTALAKCLDTRHKEWPREYVGKFATDSPDGHRKRRSLRQCGALKSV